MLNVTVQASDSILGDIKVVADKSISHRAIIFASLTEGVSTIKNLLDSEDTQRTIDFFKSFGVIFSQDKQNKYTVYSKGFLSFFSAREDKTFYMGNSGTSCRLLLGIAVGLQGVSNYTFTGDESLSKRPMLRVIKPLKQMGAKIEGTNYLPIKIRGTALEGIKYDMPVPSAQVKSAILLASLFAHGKTTIMENTRTRDHTENMLVSLGVDISFNNIDNGREITINNKRASLKPYSYKIPADFSSAAFFIVLALITKNSKISLSNVNLNPLRTGLLNVLLRMGGNIVIKNKRLLQNEEVGNIFVKSSNLLPTVVSEEEIPSMIDEIPILAICCAMAEGTSIIKGIEELNHKESNRAEAIVVNLNKLNIISFIKDNTIYINGSSVFKEGNIDLESYLDHRIAMAFFVMGACCKNPITIKGMDCIKTSFPTFLESMQELKVNFKRGLDN